MSFLFGSSGNDAEAFRGPGWEEQGNILNQLFTGNLFGANPQFQDANNSMIQSLEQQIADYQTKHPQYTQTDEIKNLQNQLGNLQGIQGSAQNYQNMFPQLNFAQRSPFQFTQTFDASRAVGDAFSPLAANLESILNRRQDEQLVNFDEEINKRGLYQSGAALQGTQNIKRDTGDQLSNALAQLAGQQAQQQLGAKQFQAQADAQREMNQAAEIFRNQGVSDQQALQLAQYAIQKQRTPIEDLFRLYGLSAGGTPGNAGQPGLLQGLAPLAGQAISMWCLPRGTKIELPNGATEEVENIKVGDKVNGGVVLAVVSRQRDSEHKFYNHKFKTGEVIMSNGHPYFDELVSISEVEHESPNTYDILTSEGFYFSNGVKLGSTIKN
jgi:hypothetical protein